MRIALIRSHATKRVCGVAIEWGRHDVIPPRVRFIRLYWQ